MSTPLALAFCADALAIVLALCLVIAAIDRRAEDELSESREGF
jgi:hypothetical protein